MENKKQEEKGKDKCVICKKEFIGFGNNPYPIKDDGRCCDNCNKRVIIERIIKLQEKTKCIN